MRSHIQSCKVDRFTLDTVGSDMWEVQWEVYTHTGQEAQRMTQHVALCGLCSPWPV